MTTSTGSRPRRGILLMLALALFGFSQPAAAFFWKKKKPVESTAAPIAEAPAESTAQLTARAQSAYQRGELRNAGKLFVRAQKQDGKDPALTFNAGIFFFQVQNHSRAARYLNQTLSLNPDHALAFFYLGLMAEQAGDQNRALDLYGQAARRDKRVLEARHNKEIVRSKLVMDVRLRRYLEGDRPLDFAPVAPPPLVTEKAVEKAPAKPDAPVVKTDPKPEPKPEPKPAPPAPEIRIETKPDTPSDKLPPTAKPAAKPAPVRPAPPPPPQRPDPEEEQEREAPAPPPLPPGPVTELPDIDRPD